jgi:hypothetical protein
LAHKVSIISRAKMSRFRGLYTIPSDLLAEINRTLILCQISLGMLSKWTHFISQLIALDPPLIQYGLLASFDQLVNCHSTHNPVSRWVVVEYH